MNTQNVLSTARRMFGLDTPTSVLLTDEQIEHAALVTHRFGHLSREGFHAGVRFAEEHYKIGAAPVDPADLAAAAGAGSGA